MAMQTYRAGELVTFVDNAAAATVTLTLPAPGAGLAWVIDMIAAFALGTLTVFDIEVLKNDALTKIARVGGQVNAGALSLHQTTQGPVVTAVNDSPKIVLTATGATAVELSVTARLKNAA